MYRIRIRTLLTREVAIPEATAIFAISFLVSAALGILRQSVFNAVIGTGQDAAAFYAAFRLPETLTSLIAGGALSNALIPVLIDVRRQRGAADEHRLIAIVWGALLATTIVAALIGTIAAPTFVAALIAPGFDAPTAALTVRLTQLLLLQTIPLAAVSIGIAVLNSRNQFLLTGLAIALHNLAQIAGIAATALDGRLGVYGPALGILVDVMVELGILWAGLRANGYRLTPSWNPHDRLLRRVVGLLVPNGLSAGVNYLGAVVDTAFGSLAPERGAVPAIYNAALLVGLPVRLFGTALAQAAFPRFAAAASDGDAETLISGVRRALVTTMALGVVAALGFWLVGRWLIALLFERGKFDASAGDLTFALLLAFAIGLPAYVGTEVLSRALIALQDTRTPLFTNCGQLGVRLLICALFTPTVGAATIPLAFAISSALETIALAAVFRWKLRR